MYKFLLTVLCTCLLAACNTQVRTDQLTDHNPDDIKNFDPSFTLTVRTLAPRYNRYALVYVVSPYRINSVDLAAYRNGRLTYQITQNGKQKNIGSHPLTDSSNIDCFYITPGNYQFISELTADYQRPMSDPKSAHTVTETPIAVKAGKRYFFANTIRYTSVCTALTPCIDSHLTRLSPRLARRYMGLAYEAPDALLDKAISAHDSKLAQQARGEMQVLNDRILACPVLDFTAAFEGLNRDND